MFDLPVSFIIIHRPLNQRRKERKKILIQASAIFGLVRVTQAVPPAPDTTPPVPVHDIAAPPAGRAHLTDALIRHNGRGSGSAAEARDVVGVDLRSDIAVVDVAPGAALAAAVALLARAALAGVRVAAARRVARRGRIVFAGGRRGAGDVGLGVRAVGRVVRGVVVGVDVRVDLRLGVAARVARRLRDLRHLVGVAAVAAFGRVRFGGRVGAVGLALVLLHRLGLGLLALLVLRDLCLLHLGSLLLGFAELLLAGLGLLPGSLLVLGLRLFDEGTLGELGAKFGGFGVGVVEVSAVVLAVEATHAGSPFVAVFSELRVLVFAALVAATASSDALAGPALLLFLLIDHGAAVRVADTGRSAVALAVHNAAAAQLGALGCITESAAVGALAAQHGTLVVVPIAPAPLEAAVLGPEEEPDGAQDHSGADEGKQGQEALIVEAGGRLGARAEIRALGGALGQLVHRILHLRGRGRVNDGLGRGGAAQERIEKMRERRHGGVVLVARRCWPVEDA